MKKIIIAIITLIAASFLVSFLFNDFHIELKKVGGEFIRMVGITLLVYILLRDPFKKRN
jgi:predicted tellurium resistance membrane protein TerC